MGTVWWEEEGESSVVARDDTLPKVPARALSWAGPTNRVSSKVRTCMQHSSCDSKALE